MTARSKKITVDDGQMPKKEEKTLEDILNKAAEQAEKVEKSSDFFEERPKGAQDGVFIPPKYEPEVKKPEKEIQKDEIVKESQIPEEKPSLKEVLTEILNVQKGKRAVPSLITFYSARSNAYRHVIVDVTDSIVEDAWAKYKELSENVDEEEFMGLVYDILETDVPRMYRAVGPVTLKK